MYYRYNEQYTIIEKSETPLEGINVVIYGEDLDFHLYDIIVGHIDEATGEMLKHTKILRSAEVIAQRLQEIDVRQAEAELETDYRLSLLELGLA